MDQKCTQHHLQLSTLQWASLWLLIRSCISLTIAQHTPDILKAWSVLSMNMVYGQKQAYLPSVRNSNANLAKLPAAVNGYYLCSLILFPTSPSWKNWSHHKGKYVTFTQNFIMNQTSSSSIGVQSNSGITILQRLQTWKKWKRMLWLV